MSVVFFHGDPSPKYRVDNNYVSKIHFCRTRIHRVDVFPVVPSSNRVQIHLCQIVLPHTFTIEASDFTPPNRAKCFEKAIIRAPSWCFFSSFAEPFELTHNYCRLGRHLSYRCTDFTGSNSRVHDIFFPLRRPHTVVQGREPGLHASGLCAVALSQGLGRGRRAQRRKCAFPWRGCAYDCSYGYACSIRPSSLLYAFEHTPGPFA